MPSDLAHKRLDNRSVEKFNRNKLRLLTTVFVYLSPTEMKACASVNILWYHINLIALIILITLVTLITFG